jgi:hypothetical protein
MEISNAQFTADGNITALVDGVLVTIPADAGNRHYAAMVAQGITPKSYPMPTRTERLAAKHEAINAERDRRINAGVTVSVTGYGDIPVQGREEDRINTLALKDTARDLIAAGITDPIVPFRDADNVLHMLTPAQTAELADKGKTAAASIYQVAWAMKDGTAPFEAGIPDDITDDQWWP